jgi:dTDP-4-amino-4,6-dideoxygalactose transaminase
MVVLSGVFRKDLEEGKLEKPKVMHELEIAHGSIYGQEERRAVMEALDQSAPSCGPKVKEFEETFAAYCGVRFAQAVTSATAGLHLAGLAVGIEQGDEVITTPNSWIATSMAFSVLGADLKFCDVDPRTLNLDPENLEALITKKTKAIVPVHLAGQCCRMDRINEIAGKHGIPVIDDCAHSPGGEYNGKKVGSLAQMSVFSFHQQKNMCTLGEGGMVTTDDHDLYERALSYRSLRARNYGQSYKYLPIDEKVHPMNKEYWRMQFDGIGYNFRMTDIQAAVGIEQLKKLDAHNARRIELAEMLTAKLSGVPGLTLPYVDPKGKHVFHFYFVQLEEEFPVSKREFMWRLYTEKGIKAWSHYMPIHLTDPYRAQGHAEGECPVAEQTYHKYVSLPIHPRLDEQAIDYMVESIREIAGAN